MTVSIRRTVSARSQRHKFGLEAKISVIGRHIGPGLSTGLNGLVSVMNLSHSCPWVGLTHGLGWVGSTTAKVLKLERIILMHLKHG